jgi:predicted ATPase
MFKPDHREKNFGNALTGMQVQGVRAHKNTVVDIANPITAFSGVNGIGKTTLLQLAALAYRSPDPEKLRSYRSDDFFVVGKLDRNPYAESARVEFSYAGKETIVLSKSRAGALKSSASKPERHVFFSGIGHFLPQAERRDFTVHQAGRTAALSNTRPVSEVVRDWTQKIFGHHYENFLLHTLTREYSVRGKTYQKPVEVASVERGGAQYSEAHMGYGEGRTQFLLRAIESLPDKALVLIEEPEASLHQGAQYMFGKYLVDVAKRKRHQILLTTHSEFVLDALPEESRIYLQRSSSGITSIAGIMPSQARSLLAEGRSKALVVLIEDDVAEALLRELIRRFRPELLPTIRFHAAGSVTTIHQAMHVLRDAGLPVVAVRDADIGEDPERRIWRLPGDKLPPEKQLLSSGAVREHLRLVYGISMDDFMASLSGVDHHSWFERLAHKVAQPRAVLIVEAARAHVSGLSLPQQEEAGVLIQRVGDAVRSL